jgi:Domain of unknown function (DU1801)
MKPPKTRVTPASVKSFLDRIEDPQTREDCYAISDLMRAATQAEPRMWGSSIVGFGAYQMTYADGRSGEFMLTAFAPRKRNITLYIMPGFDGDEALLAKLGKHSHGKSCLYIRRLADVHLRTLKTLVAASVANMRRKYPG